MKRDGSLLAITALVVAGYLANPGPVSAYVDPSSGGMLLQILIGFIISLLVSIKLFWAHLKAFFSRYFSRTPTSEGEE